MQEPVLLEFIVLHNRHTVGLSFGFTVEDLSGPVAPHIDLMYHGNWLIV